MLSRVIAKNVGDVFLRQCILKIRYLFKKLTSRTCNNMTKTIVFTLQQQDDTATKAGRNVNTHGQHRII